MALGKVSITTAVAGTPTFAEPEGVGLFLGEVTSGDGSLKAIGRETDLVALFGAALDLVDTLEAARQNGGPNWKAWAYGHKDVQKTIGVAAAVDKTGGKVGIPVTAHGIPTGETITIAGTTNYDASYAVDPDTTVNEIVIVAAFAIETFDGTETVTWNQTWETVIAAALPGCDPEFLVICKPVIAGAELTDLQTELTTQLALHRRMFAIAAFRGYLTVTDADWSAYLTTAGAITNAIDAARVMIVPQVFGNELGGFAGRLQKVLDERSPKISRSPMRVESGSVVNPGALAAELLDDTGAALELTHLEALDGDRFSVFQWYVGREGIYFADGNLLAASGSNDPAVIEYLRLLDKAARRLRQIAIAAIADDQVVNTPAGNAAFATRLSLPLRQMVALGEIKPLARDALVVTWIAVDKVKVSFTVRPPNSPKDITGEITLDTS